MSRAPARRRYFVQRRFQGRFIAVFALLAFLGAAATAVATGMVTHRAIGHAMFRGHFAERSTGELILPAILRVNGIAAATLALCSGVLAWALLRRGAGAVDALSAWLVAWRRGRPLEASDTAPSRGRWLALAAGPSRSWTADLHTAWRDADKALRAAYRSAGDDARELQDAAGRLDAALAHNGLRQELEGELDTIATRSERVHLTLARFACERGT